MEARGWRVDIRFDDRETAGVTPDIDIDYPVRPAGSDIVLERLIAIIRES